MKRCVHTSVLDLEQDDEDGIDEHDDCAPQVNLEPLALCALVRDHHGQHDERKSERAVYKSQ